MDLKIQSRKLPDKPGVYIFLNKQGDILYIGRATSLRNRVASYFRNDADLKTREMIERAVELKRIVTDTVIDSVILEANLIKKHWPKYNVREKDDRSFIYIIIDKSDYPKPITIRGKELAAFPAKDFSIFGPYKSLQTAKEILKITRRIFPYGACKPFSGKPCFHYQIGLCPGACIGAISKKDYRKNISNLILFLSGEKKRLLKKLMKENPKKAKMLKYIQDVSLINNSETCPSGRRVGNLAKRIEAYDISHFAGKETYGAMVVFENGHENKDKYRLFKIKKAPPNDDIAALKETTERRFKHKEWPFPNLIVIDGGRPQVLAVSRVLRENNMKIPLLGISKLQPASRTGRNDKLIFPLGTKKSFQEMAEASKNVLLRARDEAHRFANFARKRRKRIDMGL